MKFHAKLIGLVSGMVVGLAGMAIAQGPWQPMFDLNNSSQTVLDGDGIATGDIDMDTYTIKSTTQVLELGTAASSGHGAVAGDTIIGGSVLEVDAATHFDLQVTDHWIHQFEVHTWWTDTGGSNRYMTMVAQGDDGWHIAIDDDNAIANNNLILTAEANWNKDHDHDTLSPDPTFIVHSGTDPDSDNTEYGYIRWDELALGESAAPTAVADHGILYIDTSNQLRYMDEGGADTVIGGSQVENVKSFSHTGDTDDYHYMGGFYEAPAADVTLTIGGTTTQVYGTAGEPKAAHLFIVTGGDGATTGGPASLVVTGASITDAGVVNGSDSETILADVSSETVNDYYETSKKWLGQVTVTLTANGASAATISFNYGFSKYDDMANRDFTITSFETLWEGEASETGGNIELLLHSSAGWTYSAAAFLPGGNAIANMTTDLTATYDNWSANEYYSYKRSGLSQAVTGSGSEGFLIRVTAPVNNSFSNMDAHVGMTF